MIVVDTSALMAILEQEPEADPFITAIGACERVVVGAPTAFEFHLVVLRKKGPAFQPRAEALLALAPIEILPWKHEHVMIAAEALARFRGKPARLNFGDCMAYAVARSLDAPLLFKGEDFLHTDIRPALG